MYNLFSGEMIQREGKKILILISPTISAMITPTKIISRLSKYFGLFTFIGIIILKYSFSFLQCFPKVGTQLSAKKITGAESRE